MKKEMINHLYTLYAQKATVWGEGFVGSTIYSISLGLLFCVQLAKQRP